MQIRALPIMMFLSPTRVQKCILELVIWEWHTTQSHPWDSVTEQMPSALFFFFFYPIERGQNLTKEQAGVPT